jgi:peptidoglycan/LPS O-acetylase OafA/YrhL
MRSVNRPGPAGPSTPAKGDSGSPGAGSRVAHDRFRPDIEGLRAVAVLAVVLFHGGVPGVGGGFIGVDVFFVISGFLITGLLWREVSTSGTVRLRGFYGARARRLLPASATVGVVVVICSAVVLPPLDARRIIGDAIASALYVSNVRFALQNVDYFTASAISPSPFQHYWSLGVEEQFYLVWPAVIIATAWLVRRARRRTGTHALSSVRPYLVALLLIGAVSFAASLVITRMVPPVAFFSLPTRAWELAVGGLVALTVAQWRRLSPLSAAVAGWAGLAVILLGCTRLGATTPYPGTAALIPVLGTALVIGAGCAAPARGVGRVLALRPMRAVGRVSYSWYLWHWPVQLLLVSLTLPGHPMTGRLVGGVAGAVLSAGLAALTLRFIENPVRYAAPVCRSAARSLALGGAVTAVAVSVGVALLIVVPNPVGRGPAAPTLTVTAAPVPAGRNVELYDAAVQHAFAQVQAAVTASADLKAVPSNLDPPLARAGAEKASGCFLGLYEVDQPECATGDTASTTTVALIGDSNALMWSPAFQQLAAPRHWRLETLTKGACPLLDLPYVNPVIGREYTECDRWRAQVIARLQTEHPRLIVLSMYRGYGATTSLRPYESVWIESLTRLVELLRGTGAQVLVLGPIPQPDSVVPDCLSVHLDDATACSPLRAKAVNQPGIAAETSATKAGAGQYADLTALFCAADRCPVIVGNTLVYRDNYHLTLEYSRLLAPVIGALTDRALICDRGTVGFPRECGGFS